MQVAPVATLPTRLTKRGGDVLPGVLVCAAIALVATLIGGLAPFLGAAIPAVVIGFVVGSIRKPSGRVAPGIQYSSKFVLQCAVVLLGAKLSLENVIELGRESVPVTLIALSVTLFAAWGIGRLMGVDRKIRTLIGVGTGICGASAIAATAPIIRAKNADISYALSTIFLFNLLAVLAFPVLGHAIGMTPHQFGVFAGIAINDTSSVVAAASVFSASALGIAVVVKLVRTLMIIPISVFLAIGEMRREADGTPLTIGRVFRMIPWFLIGFLIVAGASSLGLFTDTVTDALTSVSVFMIAMALAAIGMLTDFSAIRSAGMKPLVLGLTLSIIMAGTAFLTMTAFGQLG